MIKFYKILFFNSLIMSTLMAISSYSWFSMWMGLEVNLLSMIPLMIDSENSTSSEAAMKYFISQSMASMTILFSIMIMSMKINILFIQENFMESVLNSMLLLKMGAAPLHFWFPEVIEGLSWMNSLILLTWQKISPFIILMNNHPKMNLMMMFIFSSIVISTLMAFNQSSMRKIMAYSSINHMAWMISSSMTSIHNWILYFSAYSILSMNICMILNKENLFFSSQLLSKEKKKNYILLINFLSMGGIPPFIGFLPKWIIVNKISHENMNMIAVMMIISSIILLYVYMRMFFPSMLMSQEKKKLKMNKNNYSFFYTQSMLFNSSMLMFTLSVNLN